MASAAVISDTTAPQPDGSTIRTILYADGSKSVTANPAPGSVAANFDSIRTMLVNSLATHTTYIGLASPTTTQNTAEIKALAKTADQVIRLLLPQLDSTAGT